MEDKGSSYVLQTNVDPNDSAEGISKSYLCVSRLKTAAFFMIIFHEKDVNIYGNASVYNESRQV